MKFKAEEICLVRIGRRRDCRLSSTQTPTLICMANSDIYNLEFLSLVAKITQEIDNHTGVNDKTLAEFLIHLHEQSNKSLSGFKQTLKEVGAEYPDSFIENVDRLILSMHPMHKKKHAPAANGKAVENGKEVLTEQDKKRRLFPGLALKDQEVRAPVPDDVFLEEIGDIVAGKKGRPPPTADDRAPKRQRRSPSPRRSSPSPPRGRGYGDRRDRQDDRRNGSGRPTLDNKPVLFKIYNGRVSGMKDFGAFVTLEGVAGRVEGPY